MAKFLSNVIKLFSATLAGQILGILVTPILSRLYTPSDFGVYELFFSIVSIVVVYTSFSYASAIQLPEKDEDAATIFFLCILLTFITTFFTTFGLLFFSGTIESLLNAPGFSVYLLLLPLAIISSSSATLLIAWLSRREDFGIIAKGNFCSSVTGKGISLGFGVTAPSPFGLILGSITNDATIVLVLLKKALRDLSPFENVSYERMKQLAHRYKKFPQYLVGADLAGTASVAACPLILAVFFSSAVVGYYAMALMVLRLPSKLMASALYQVFYQKACVEKNRNDSIKNIVEMVHSRLISFGIFACVIIMVLGPELFSFALGKQWTPAGIYAQIIAPWLFFAFILVPLSATFNVLEQQVASFWFSIVILVTRVAALIIGGFLADPIIAMIILSITGVIFWGWMNMYTLKIAGVSVSGALREMIRYFLFSIVFCTPLIISKYLSVQTLFLIALGVSVSVIYYAVILYHDVYLKQELMRLLKVLLRIRE